MYVKLLLSALLTYSIHVVGQVQTAICVQLHITGFAYNHQEDLVYAIVPAYAPRLKNSIVVIDPETGNFLDSLQLDHEPAHIRITADDAFIYVSYLDHPSIAKFKVPELTQSSIINLEYDNVSYYSNNFIILGNSDTSIAVLESLSPNQTALLSVYKNGIHLDSSYQISHSEIVMACNEIGTRLFANNQSSGWDFFEFSVQPSGIRFEYETNLVKRETNTGIKIYKNQMLTSYGELYDLTDTIPIKTGQFYLGYNGSHQESFEIGINSNRAAFITYELTNHQPWLYLFDTSNFARVEPNTKIDLVNSFIPESNYCWDLKEAKNDRYILLFGNRFKVYEAGHLIIVQRSYPASILTTDAKGSLCVYPNPAIDVITLDGLETSIDYEITDTQGRIVHSAKTQPDQLIDVSHLVSGTYFLNCDEGKRKFVIDR
ncbi:MAG: T9SS type A sorting domain-containing protein [Flavobacteriales bacterium]